MHLKENDYYFYNILKTITKYRQYMILRLTALCNRYKVFMVLKVWMKNSGVNKLAEEFQRILNN